MSHPKKYQIHLAAPERQALQEFVSCGKKQAREITRARILLLADEGPKDAQIMALLGLSRPTVCSIRKKYAEGGYEPILDLLPDAPAAVDPSRSIAGWKPRFLCWPAPIRPKDRRAGRCI